MFQSVRSRVLMLVLVGACAPWAQAAPPPDIRSVLDVALQSCNGGGGEAWTRHPREAAIRRDGGLDVPGLGWRFRMPRLAGPGGTVLKIRGDDRSRGVVDHYLLLAAEEHGVPFGAIVVTELPPGIDSREGAFAAARTVEEGLARTLGGFRPAFTELDGPYGRAMEMLVPGRIATPCFPTSEFAVAPPGGQTLGITRFAYIAGRLVEFSLVVPQPPGQDAAQHEAHARAAMDRFWTSITPP